VNRKQRRTADKKRSNGDAEQAMAEQVHMFGKLPAQCDICQKSFDKKDKDMVFSWSVVVRSETVRLFCPQCIEKTKEVLDEYAKEK
jgi:hypothetical protein